MPSSGAISRGARATVPARRPRRRCRFCSCMPTSCSGGWGSHRPWMRWPRSRVCAIPTGSSPATERCSPISPRGCPTSPSTTGSTGRCSERTPREARSSGPSPCSTVPSAPCSRLPRRGSGTPPHPACPSARTSCPRSRLPRATASSVRASSRIALMSWPNAVARSSRAWSTTAIGAASAASSTACSAMPWASRTRCSARRSSTIPCGIPTARSI